MSARLGSSWLPAAHDSPFWLSACATLEEWVGGCGELVPKFFLALAFHLHGLVVLPVCGPLASSSRITWEPYRNSDSPAILDPLNQKLWGQETAICVCLFFKTASLRYNSHSIKSTCLEYTIQRFFGKTTELGNHHHKSVTDISITPVRPLVFTAACSRPL